MKNKSFQTPSAKPCDVEYRVKRLQQTLEDAAMFLGSVDPSVFPELHAEAAAALAATRASAAKLVAPAKKPRKAKPAADA